MLSKCTGLSLLLVDVMSYYNGLLYFQCHRYSLAQIEEEKLVTFFQNFFLFPAQSAFLNCYWNLIRAGIFSCGSWEVTLERHRRHVSIFSPNASLCEHTNVGWGKNSQVEFTRLDCNYGLPSIILDCAITSVSYYLATYVKIFSSSFLPYMYTSCKM